MFSRSRITPIEQERATNELHSVIASLREEIAEIRKAQSEPSEWLERVTTKKIIVHQKNNASIEGLLVLNLRDGIVLRSASLLNSGAASTPMAGEVFIPREQIALVQLDG